LTFENPDFSIFQNPLARQYLHRERITSTKYKKEKVSLVLSFFVDTPANHYATGVPANHSQEGEGAALW